ncbi:pleckstrin homology domain-containing family D member 1-like [Ostrea edulis]|uniref:pleckstrin homology domain-containing family D member 1-like n=1 Tax=Ostrea edulis TaxID=37623 RepID=UPI0024AEE562|nr:pleckstrin homology domain-containing family D member 1-like [Ostrea edulis]
MDCFCCFCRRYKHGSTVTMNGTQESRNSNSYDWTQDIQLHGLLYKKPINHQSNKWTKRYFVIKDGFLLYYPDTEKKDLEKRKCLNVHPKGIIPLGECTIEAVRENGQPYAISLESAEIAGKLLLAADNSFDRDKWIDMLQKSKRITWKSSKLADEMINQLEEHGLQMAKQKQDYFDQLQSEVMALSDEREKTEELARINQELEKEKEKIEKYQQELIEEFDQVKQELEDTNQYMQEVEKDRQELSSTISHQQEALQLLDKEKHRIMSTLEEQENQKQTLHATHGDVEDQLKKIENKMRLLQAEKAETERRLTENEEKAHILEEEKQHFDEQAQQLNETIKDLRTQKEMTEAELKEEVMARMDAERKLKEAEESLRKLGVAVDSQTTIIKEDVHQEMVVNVRKLKQFFEGLVMEAEIDEDKPMIVKNSIHARKTLQRRAKTNKFKRARSSSLRAKSSNFDEAKENDGLAPIRRCVTTVRRNFAQSVNFTIGGGGKLLEEEYL